MKPQANPYPLRLEDEVMEKMKQIAKENGRSVNKEIEFALKKYRHPIHNDTHNIGAVLHHFSKIFDSF